ncbi:MAG: NADH-quinone oxidoreductase subunit C, partial [Gallionellaceae bacterium]|nr:NADH-quinone oxidoreductase subunit C [Gallionellaceae bacterium]
MATDLSVLQENLTRLLEGKVVSLENRLGELTLVIRAADMLPVLTRLRDDADLRFEQMMDLCGVDYSTHGDGAWEGKRF